MRRKAESIIYRGPDGGRLVIPSCKMALLISVMPQLLNAGTSTGISSSVIFCFRRADDGGVKQSLEKCAEAETPIAAS